MRVSGGKRVRKTMHRNVPKQQRVQSRNEKTKRKAMAPFGSHMLQYKSMAFWWTCLFTVRVRVEREDGGGGVQKNRREVEWSRWFHPFASLGKHDR